MSVTVAVIYHSGYGHTAKQAEAVNRGAASVADTKTLLIKVEDIEQHWDALDSVDAIIFGAPTYMGSVSGPFKMFMDASSKVWFTGKWANKVAAGFTNSASRSGDKLNSLIQLAIFAAQHGMIWTSLGLPPGHNGSKTTEDTLNRHGFFLGAGAQSDHDAGPDTAPPPADLKTAEHLGGRVAKLAHELAAGRKATMKAA